METGKLSANKTIIMEVSATTTIISNKYEVNIEFKFTELDKHYVGNKLWLEKPFKILEYFHGYVNIWAIMHNGQNAHLLIAHIANVENLSGKIFDLAAEPYFAFRTYLIPPMMKRSRRASTLRINIAEGDRKLKTVFGTLRLSFEASKGQLMKQTLMNGFSGLNNHCNKGRHENSEKSQETEKIKIICENCTIMLEKSLLCSISDVFKAMFQNPDNVESRNGTVCLEDIDPRTIEGFERMLKSNIIKEEDLNVGMLLFSDRYNIQPIVQLCLEHLRKNITKENFVEIAKASDLINDKDLLQAAANFITKNIGTFDDDPDIRNFMRSNTDCFSKVLETMMFKK